MSDNPISLPSMTTAPFVWNIDLSAEKPPAKPFGGQDEAAGMALISTALNSELVASYEHRTNLDGTKTMTTVDNSSLLTSIEDQDGHLKAAVRTQWEKDGDHYKIWSNTVDVNGNEIERNSAVAPVSSDGDLSFSMLTVDANGDRINKGFVDAAFNAKGDLHMQTKTFNQDNASSDLLLTDIFDKTQISTRVLDKDQTPVFDFNGSIEYHNWLASWVVGNSTVTGSGSER